MVEQRADGERMKIVLLYLRIVKRSRNHFPAAKNYEESTVRFLETYTKFKPKIPHDLIIVNCGGYKPDTLLDPIATDYVTSVCSGFDCGTYQEMNRFALCYDFAVAMNTHVYFWRDDWLEKLSSAAQFFGPGFYGPTASFEINPHLRTPCIAYHPGIMADYPHLPRNRDECAFCESGSDNFSLWCMSQGFPAMLVTADGTCWEKDNWRKPPNIFRRGDQSNVLVYDRHTEVYANSSPDEKALLESGADSLPKPLEPQPRPIRPKPVTSRRPVMVSR